MLVLYDEPEAEEILAKTKESQVGMVFVNPVEVRRLRHNERQRAYVERNREKVYAKNAVYDRTKYERSEKRKQTAAAWREKNREKIREYDRNWRKK